MTTPKHARPAETYAEVEDALLSRWPETKLEPCLDRIRAFTELLGDPQRGCPVIHLTGTNGKTSTAADDRPPAARARPADRPLHQPAPGADERADQHRRRAARATRTFVRGVQRRCAVHPPRRRRAGRTRCRSSRPSSAMAYAAFADAPVDVAVVEVGMGGAWDATNVADAEVAVVLPIAVDHAKYLGDTAGRHRGREGRHHQARLRSRSSPSSRPRSPRSCSSGPSRSARPWPARAWSSASISRVPAVGGQVLTPAGSARPLRRRLPAAVRRAPGPERRGGAGRRRGVRRRRAARRRDGAGGVRRGHLARAGSRSSAAARRSCSTPPTTRTAPRPRPPRSRTPSASHR